MPKTLTPRKINDAKEFITAADGADLIYYGAILRVLREVKGDDWVYEFLKEECGLDKDRYEFFSGEGCIQCVDRRPNDKSPMDTMMDKHPNAVFLK
jgi:hypothetical protein